MSYPDTRVQEIAKVCHEVNRAYCEGTGDMSQKPWHEAPMWQRESVCNGVRFALANPGVTPAQMHESWLAEKRAAGWHYGVVKDEKLKTHPCFCAYDELDAAQRVKDHLFAAVVRAMR